MDDPGFKALVAQMREAQRRWFKTRDRKWLERSLELEKQVDEALTEKPLFGAVR